MKYDYAVKVNGKIYKAGTEIPGYKDNSTNSDKDNGKDKKADKNDKG